MAQSFFHSARHALRGLAYVWREELNFRIQTACAVLAIIAMIVLRFTYLEVGFALLTIMLVLAAEVFNTLLEDILDIIEPNHHRTVGRLKDMMAGVVLVVSLGALAIGAAIVLHLFNALL